MLALVSEIRLQALEFVTSKCQKNAGGVFILRDFQRFLEDIAVSRELRNLARSSQISAQRILLLVAPQVQIPEELTRKSLP